MNPHQKQTQFPLSDLHDSLTRLRRVYDAAEINTIVNHPAVLRNVGGIGAELDLSGFVSDSANIAFVDDGAAALFNKLAPGLYEIHSMALPQRRGRHTAAVGDAAMHVMFTRTDAIEIITRVPVGKNLAALSAARRAGFRHEFTTPHGWITPSGSEPVHWLRLDIVSWMSRAPGLVERGAWFHEAVEAACERAGVTREHHPEDETHNRYAGAACEMVLAGRADKGLHFLNRFNAMTRAKPVVVMTVDPFVIHIGDLALAIDTKSAHIEICKGQ